MHPTHGPVKVAASPVQFNEEASAVHRVAPDSGQDTETILLELGLSGDEIGNLKDQDLTFRDIGAGGTQ